MFGNMEVCHEDIHRCSYVDLANRHSLGHSDRKRGPCVPGELRIREWVLTNFDSLLQRLW